MAETVAEFLGHWHETDLAVRDARLRHLSAKDNARIADVWLFAREVWGGDEAVKDFFFRPHPMLDGRLPYDVVLAIEAGRARVTSILGGLRYGSAA